MITNHEKLEEIKHSWETVEKLCRFETMIVPVEGGVFQAASAMPEPFWNFPFFLAYAVLDDALNVLQSEGYFQSGTWKLSLKMQASRSVLPWQDFCLVDNGRDARNDLAHKARFLEKAECLKYVTAVKEELKAWNIL